MDELTPRRILGFDILDGMIIWQRWRFRALFYTPFDRQNWQFDPIFNEDVWQLGIGPVVFVYVRSEDW